MKKIQGNSRSNIRKGELQDLFANATADIESAAVPPPPGTTAVPLRLQADPQEDDEDVAFEATMDLDVESEGEAGSSRTKRTPAKQAPPHKNGSGLEASPDGKQAPVRGQSAGERAQARGRQWSGTSGAPAPSQPAVSLKRKGSVQALPPSKRKRLVSQIKVRNENAIAGLKNLVTAGALSAFKNSALQAHVDRLAQDAQHEQSVVAWAEPAQTEEMVALQRNMRSTLRQSTLMLKTAKVMLATDGADAGHAPLRRAILEYAAEFPDAVPIQFCLQHLLRTVAEVWEDRAGYTRLTTAISAKKTRDEVTYESLYLSLPTDEAEIAQGKAIREVIAYIVKVGSTLPEAALGAGIAAFTAILKALRDGELRGPMAQIMNDLLVLLGQRLPTDTENDTSAKGLQERYDRIVQEDQTFFKMFEGKHGGLGPKLVFDLHAALASSWEDEAHRPALAEMQDLLKTNPAVTDTNSWASVARQCARLRRSTSELFQKANTELFQTVDTKLVAVVKATQEGVETVYVKALTLFFCRKRRILSGRSLR